MNLMQGILKKFKETAWKFFSKVWYGRGLIPILNFPIPWRLPYGGWCLLYPDESGLNLFWSIIGKLYEEGEWRFLLKFIKPGMVCLDVGANQGFYTILLSKIVGPQGKVYAFEPLMSELKKLKRNVLINRLPYNLILENIAIGSHNGRTEIVICLDGHGSRSSLRNPPEEVKARTSIEQVVISTLDSYVERNKIEHIDFVKIDVEGAERDVLIGGERVIKTLHPLIMIEVSDVTAEMFGYKASEIINILKSYGYLLFFKPMSNGFLKSIKLKDTWRENVIAIHNENLYQIINFISEDKEDKVFKCKY